MAMDPRTQFLLQLLQKLGAPLMAAVNTHSQGDANGEKDAGTLASLLSESVKISISLSQAMNLKPDDGDADAIRVALAALAGGLIADSYKQNGRVPNENEGRRISKALESVIVFADNFAPAAEHAQRLKTLDNAAPFFDPVQTDLYAMHALVPAISAISEFSFGEPEPRLIQDVSDRLDARAKELMSSMSAAGNAMSELVILQALSQLYADAHRAETKRLKAQGGDAQASIDTVWASFDKQASMVAVLLGSMSGSSTASSGGSSGGVKPAAPPPTLPQPPESPAAATPAAPPASALQAGGSPMAFFKKK